MAITAVGSQTSYYISRYIGLSTDVKPTTCDPGSVFTELDTGKKFIWDGSAWAQVKNPVEVLGTNQQVGNDLTATWADSAAVNTVVNVDVALPTVLQGNAKYEVIIYNPSAVTTLTVVAQNKAASLGGGDRYAELTRWTVLTSSTKAVLVEGWLIGSAGRLALSNDTALGAGQGFSASIRIIEI